MSETIRRVTITRPGPQGPRGSSWSAGSGAPSGSAGSVGDWYIDTDTLNYYEKTASSTWTLRGNFGDPTASGEVLVEHTPSGTMFRLTLEGNINAPSITFTPVA